MPNTQKPRIKWVNPAQLVVPEERVWSELTEEQEEMLREDIRKHGEFYPAGIPVRQTGIGGPGLVIRTPNIRRRVEVYRRRPGTTAGGTRFRKAR